MSFNVLTKGPRAQRIMLESKILAAAASSPPSTQRAWRGILMPRSKNCRETIFAAQLPRNLIYPHRRANFERRKKRALSCGGEAIWGGILRDNLGEGNCESKIAARQWGVNFCCEASRCLARPSGHRVQNHENPKSLKKVSREEFWDNPDPGPQKSPQKKSEKSRKSLKINYFLDSSRLFRGPGSEVPKSSRETFLRLFGFSGFWTL